MSEQQDSVDKSSYSVFTLYCIPQQHMAVVDEKWSKEEAKDSINGNPPHVCSCCVRLTRFKQITVIVATWEFLKHIKGRGKRSKRAPFETNLWLIGL